MNLSRRMYLLSMTALTALVLACLACPRGGSSAGRTAASLPWAPFNTWAHDATGVTSPSNTWYLAEGCTEEGFETWVLVANPNDTPEEISMTLFTDRGEVAGPGDTIPARSRRSYNLASYVTTYDVSIKVESSGAGVVCERAMYGERDPEVLAPFDDFPLYPFTRDESIACGAWPPGSLDYPYFGAPREGTRLHAGIDIYPPEGPGAEVLAMKAGTVIRVEPFYTRYTGEVTWEVLVDHGDYIVNYGEVYPPALSVGDHLEQGDLVGLVSGTRQLHLELYAPGTTDWLLWYGPQPANLLDPTPIMLEAFGL